MGDIWLAGRTVGSLLVEWLQLVGWMVVSWRDGLLVAEWKGGWQIGWLEVDRLEIRSWVGGRLTNDWLDGGQLIG
jgi:hypothetical protein